MKILHIDLGAEMRGGQRQALLIMRLLREAGHECSLLSRPASPLWFAAKECGFEVGKGSTLKVMRHSGGYDLVHVHDARAHTAAALASQRPFVVSRRVAFPVKQSWPSRLKYRRAARFIAVSSFVAEQLRIAGIAPDRIDVVYDGVEPVQPAESWSPEFPAVAIASQDPGKAKALLEQASKHCEIEVVYSDDLARDLRRCSMFVYLSYSEGLGSAVLLAMQMGVPVIASAVGGLKEIFEDGVSGLYVRNDVEEVADAMRRVIRDKGLSSLLIENARERIRTAFTPEHLLRGTLASYKRALG